MVVYKHNNIEQPAQINPAHVASCSFFSKTSMISWSAGNNQLLSPQVPQFINTHQKCHWYDCIASYTHMGTLFAILPMFPRCSDYAATSAKSHFLHFLLVTFLQLVLHVGRGHRFTVQMILYHRSSILHILWHPLPAFENCTLPATLCLFATFACFCDFDQIVHQKLIPDIMSIGSIT